MRLDKFLKISRLVKRRPVADSMASGGKITIDERLAKSSSKIREGQIIEIDYGKKKLKIKVLTVPGKALSKQDAKELYEIIDEIWIKEI